jgi:nucleotide-binding universal stress UspA family protein
MAMRSRSARIDSNLDEEARGMDDASILICDVGSDDALRAIDAAAELLSPRRAIVLDVGPPLTAAESYAAMSTVAPGAAFEELNVDDALRRARTGAVIVLGSRGLQGAREVFEGSISHQVAEHAGRPVLIVPPPNGDR